MRMSKDFHSGSSLFVPARRRRLVSELAVLLAFLALLILPAHFPSSAQQASQTVTTSAARNAALVAATQEVLQETSQLRQLSILRPVQSSTQSREEIQRAVIKDLDAE